MSSSTATAHRPPIAATERSGQRCVAGRYLMRRVLGKGGHGEVWEAEDTLTSALVAVKLLAGDGVEPARVRREVSALRMLRVPGVVQMLDEGIDGACPFLVMELVTGEPFPGGGRREWRAVAGVAATLLETLARVHAAGVVHRDLKPGNVLVNCEGRPIILDFGLSIGPSLGGDLTARGFVLGTPAYLAPEQIVGEPVTFATDLYAVGVMLFEALSGRLPHEADDFLTLMRLRLLQAPPPLRDVADEVPAAVARTVDSLLARSPEDRPRSAEEALDRLLDRRSFPSAPALPRLGGDAAIRRLLEAARARRPLDLAGAPGAGRSRCLAEVAEALEREGVPVRWACPGTRPFASLQGIVEPLGEGGLAEVAEQVDRRLAEILAGGGVILADDGARIDRWSAAALERARDRGAVLRVLDAAEDASRAPAESDGVVVLPALREDELRPLFAGPDRIFHLPEDAARELYARTLGLPARVAAELRAWEHAGLVVRAGDSWTVGRDALDRLAVGRAALPPPLATPGSSARAAPLPGPPHTQDLLAWVEIAWPYTSPSDLARITGQPAWRVEAELEDLLDRGAAVRLPDGRVAPRGARWAAARWRAERVRGAHRAVAAALPRGAEGRLFHLVAGQDDRGAASSAEIAAEAMTVAGTLAERGHLGRAAAVLAEGLIGARRGAPPAGEEWGEARLLGLWAQIALSDGTPRALDRALYEICRARERTPEVAGLERLVRAALAMRSAAGDRALSLINADVGPFADAALERRRQQVRVQSARRSSIEREEAVLVEVARWAEESEDPFAAPSFAGWLGRLRYRQGRFDEAAELHAKAAAGERWATERVAAILNQASALLEAFRFGEAAVAATEGRALAERCRHAYFEARAAWILRAAAYRRGEGAEPDLELVDLAARVGVVDLERLVCLNEAAVAWRAPDLQRAAALARRAERLFDGTGGRWGALLARSLAFAASGGAEGEVIAAAAEAARCPVPGIGIQVIGLCARVCPEVASTLAPEMRLLRASVPEERWSQRMDVLSVDEAFAATRHP